MAAVVVRAAAAWHRRRVLLDAIPPVARDRAAFVDLRDRAAFVDLYSSPDVATYTGGARSREAVERALPATPPERPGHFVIDLDGAMVGIVELER